jgi:hypothetical protein
VWLASHAAASCQVPLELHVCSWLLDAHRVSVGPHTPEQEPATQVVLGPHALLLFCQLPIALHVWGC